MNEENQTELLKMAIQIIETVLSDKNLYNDALHKAKVLYQDPGTADYVKLLMYVKKDLAELITKPQS